MPRKPKEPMPTCMEVESAVVSLWGYRKNMIVPNISWGAGVHECDLLILTQAGWASEVEIKVSLSDLKKDAHKRHGHKSDRILNLYFAIPAKLLPHIGLIPERAGIILIHHYQGQYIGKGFRAELHRNPQANKEAEKWTPAQRANLGRLGCMRIWALKRKLIAVLRKEQK